MASGLSTPDGAIGDDVPMPNRPEALFSGSRPAELEVAAIFDGESAHYDHAYDAGLGYVLRARMATVIGLLGRGPGEFLDAGMGPGRLCAEMQARGFTAFGVDLSDRMVKLARARLPDASERLVQGTLTALPFPPASFDAVVATGVLEYVDRPDEAIREISRVLRPRGRVILSIPNQVSTYILWQRYLWHPLVRVAKRALPWFSRAAPYGKRRWLGVNEVTATMREADLEVTDVIHVSFAVVPAPFDQLLPRLAYGVAARLEQANPPGGRALATQVVVAAHKPAPAGEAMPAALSARR